MPSGAEGPETCPQLQADPADALDGPFTASGAPMSVEDYAQFGNEVTIELAGSLNPRRTVLRLLGLIQPRLADWAMLVMVGPLRDRLVMQGGRDPAFSAVIPFGATENLAVGRILRSGQTELLPVESGHRSIDGLAGLIPHESLREEATELLPTDALGLALTARGTTIGVLVLLRGPGRGFSPRHVELAEQIADRAAMALDSARLYQERGKVASVLQAGLRPSALPRIPGVQVAGRLRTAAEHLDLGGDFYDVHGGGDDWLLVLGDVCGKGVEAAVLTARVRQTIHTAAHFERRPTEILAALNEVLRATVEAPFVTVACARLRPAPDGLSATVDLAVGGHPAPLILRRDGTVEQTQVYGTALGVSAGTRYDGTSVRIERGDVMLMFTDGVDEARGPTGFYGMDRLIRLLRAYTGADPEVLCEAVEQDVVEHLGGRSHDDIALLAWGVGGPAGGRTTSS